MASVIIRAVETAWTTRVVAFYPDRLVCGTRHFGRVRFTEDMWNTEGHTLLGAQLSMVQTAELHKIDAIREEGPARDIALGERRSQCAFNVESAGRSIMRFSLDSDESANFRRALTDCLPGRYFVRHGRSRDQFPAGGCLSATIFLLGLLATFGGVFWPLTRKVDEVPWIVFVAGLFSLALGGYLLFQPRGPWLPIQPSDLNDKARRRRERHTGSVRAPFRSRFLGVLSKLLGVTYLATMLSPLSDPVLHAVEMVTRNPVAYGLLIWFPGTVLIYLGYRLCQRHYEPRDRKNSQSPVLFLRPFADDDSTTLQPPGVFAALTGVRRAWGTRTRPGRTSIRDLLLTAHPIRLFRMLFNVDVTTSEESLVRYFERIGPVVAIGKPGQRIATAGAQRTWVPDESWQETILQFLGKAHAVVVQPSRTVGVEWELQQIRQRVEPHRVLLCLVSFWRSPQAYEEMCEVIQQATGLSFPNSVPLLEQPSFISFNEQWEPNLHPLSYRNPLQWPFTGDGADLRYTLEPFTERLKGGDPLPVRAPRWKRGLKTNLVACAASFFGLALGILPVLVVLLCSFLVNDLLAERRRAERQRVQEIANQRDAERQERASNTVHGVSVPYSFTLHGVWSKRTADNPHVEHMFENDFARARLLVYAHSGQEDLSNLAEQRLTRFRLAGAAPTLVSTHEVEVDGIVWQEVKLRLSAGWGYPNEEQFRAHSSSIGTIAVSVLIGEDSPDKCDLLRRLIANTLASFRVGPSRVMNHGTAPRWQPPGRDPADAGRR